MFEKRCKAMLKQNEWLKSDWMSVTPEDLLSKLKWSLVMRWLQTPNILPGAYDKKFPEEICKFS